MATLKELQREWYQKLKDAGFEDIEKPNGELRREVHPHTQRFAFEEYEFRTGYTQFASFVLHEFEFEHTHHKEIWELHVDGVPVRSIGNELGLTRNQVWPVIKKVRTKARVKFMNQFKIREGRDTDKEFILATWLRSYKKSSDFAKRITDKVFYPWHQKLVKGILSRKTSRVDIACLPDDEDVILGYLVSELYPFVEDNQQTFHYLYVKEQWRNAGIGKSLILQSPALNGTNYFSHWTDPMKSIIDRKDIKLIYDPYRV